MTPSFKVGDRVRQTMRSGGLGHLIGTVVRVGAPGDPIWIWIQFDGRERVDRFPAWTLKHADVVTRLGEVAELTDD